LAESFTRLMSSMPLAESPLVERLAEEDRVASLGAAARRAAVAAHLHEAERCVQYRRQLAAAIQVSHDFKAGCTC
jgi:hypothetical protein